VVAQRAILYSGGKLSPEQAAYDVSFYDLALKIDPEERNIEGQLTVEASIVHPTFWLVLDLDTLLQVDAVKVNGTKITPQRKVGQLWLPFGRQVQAGERISATISYSGNPRVAPNAPWDGGFSWAKTASGAHWIATTCQSQGADLWWPCKDHVSDEPDSMKLHIEVPSELVVASNGTLQQIEKKKTTSIYHWNIDNPINIYNVALNIAPYRLIEEEMQCVDGSTYPIHFYVLPEDYEKGLKIMPEFKQHLAFFEKYFGPYPFRAEKYGVAQTPHLGMEHQSIIAYGANFDNKSMTRGIDWGFDALHHHELAHEWWGNLVTAANWKDAWIHEGFGTYTQALYLEDQVGKEKYIEYMRHMRTFQNRLPIAPVSSKTSVEAWRAPIYPKGAWILHTLRYQLGDEDFFKTLRRMAYPKPEMERWTDGRQTRFSSTDEFQQISENISGQDLDWFFDLYLKQPALPTLKIDQRADQLTLTWQSPVEGMILNMPVEVQVGKKRKRLSFKNGQAVLKLKKGHEVMIDPDSWLLMERKLSSTPQNDKQ